MNKSPAFQFYPDDFLGSPKVGTMTVEEIGVYTLLLCMDWNDTGFAYDEEDLARWCRCTVTQFRRAWKRVSRCFEERDGRLYNPRLDAERAKQQEWREKSAKGGRASAEAKAKGGGKGGSRVVAPEGEPNGNTPFPSPTPSPVTTTTSPRKAAAITRVDSTTWLSPYMAAWKQQYDGDMPVEPNVAALRTLEKQHGPDEVLRRWTLYLSRTGSAFAGAAKLKAGWGEYGGLAKPTARGAVLLDLLRRYDLFAYNGNRDEYERKVTAAAADPLAGPDFRAELSAIRPTKGEIPGQTDHFKALEIESRLARVKVPA